jgi:undecaprenyl-phosphate 4-deoxy-4-formamido-L-arabinose transferase
MTSPSITETRDGGLSIVIPCYQSEFSLNDLVIGIRDSLQRINLVNYEILLILDGPTDGTPDAAATLQNKFPECRIIELSRNFGQHAAIFAGISLSKYEFIATMDDDGQHLPSELPVLIEELSIDADLVYGIPRDDEHGFLRNIASKTFKFSLFRVLGIKNARDISAFRIFRKSLLRNVDLQKISIGTVDVALHWSTTRIKTVRTTMPKRSIGKSNYTYRTLFRFAIQMIIGYSVKPLKFALALGLFGFLASTVLTLYFLFQYFQGNIKVVGFSTVTILITTLSSIQLVTLGILGEYIASIHQKSIGKPMFNIRNPSKS